MVKIHDVDQRSWDWDVLRTGIPTASEADALLTPKFKIKEGEGPKTFLYKKVAEAFRGKPMLVSGSANSFAMEQGMILEEEALPWFSLEYDCDVRRVGFITTDDGKAGCSPDGLVGDDIGLEIKCPECHTHTRYLLQGTLPDDYAVQVHFSLYVTGFPVWTFVSYRRGFPKLVLRIERDEEKIAVIHEAVTAFHEKLTEALTKLRSL